VFVDIETTVLLLVISVMATNQLVMRVPLLCANPAVFWSLEGLQVTFGTYVLVRGLPGFEDMVAVTWLLGGLFYFHATTNYWTRTKVLRALGEGPADEARAALAAQIRANLVDDDVQRPE
jgi:hypothetical protein